MIILYETRKRLFITLLLISILVLGALFFLAWWIVSKQYLLVNKLIMSLMLVIILVLLFLFFIGIFCLIYSLIREKSNQGLNKLIKETIVFLYPLSLKIGHLLGFNENQIKQSFIQVSNQLVKLEHKQVAPEDILILAPHCLQRVQCPHKITVDAKNCKKCGLCPVGDLLNLSQELGVQLVIATGGTFARKFIKEKKPQAIIAIACERDLTSGIQDVEKIPVIGVLNERPEGPCYNTRVNLCKVEQAVNYFLKGGDF